MYLLLAHRAALNLVLMLVTATVGLTALDCLAATVKDLKKVFIVCELGEYDRYRDGRNVRIVGWYVYGIWPRENGRDRECEEVV